MKVLNAFSQLVNTREGEFAYHVDVDLPGCKKEDIKVDINKRCFNNQWRKKTKKRG